MLGVLRHPRLAVVGDERSAVGNLAVRAQSLHDLLLFQGE